MNSDTILTNTPEKGSLRFVILVSLVAALGGFLFGFDTSVMSGANGYLRLRFGLGDAMLGWTVSCIIIGCIAGAAFAGMMGNRFGRKRVLIVSALLYIIGIGGSALAGGLVPFIALRMLEGVAIGINCSLCPMYNAEIAPAKYRGRLVALTQMATVTAILSGMLLSYFVAGAGNEAWNITSGWRFMFGAGVVPGTLFLVLLFFVPESPRWLIQKGRAEEALPILLRIHGNTAARQEVVDIKRSFAEETKLSFGDAARQLMKGNTRKILVIGTIVAMTQQITGINAVMYYAPEIFRQTGSGTSGSLLQTLLVGVVNVVFTALSLWLVDKLGRKLLLLIGSGVMTVSLFLIGVSFELGQTGGLIIMVCILAYVAAFAVSLGAVVWVLLAEMFPNRIRGVATAIANMALWAMNFVVSQSFPSLLSSIGPGKTFWIYGAAALFTFLFTMSRVPETKGKSLEEIEAMWEKDHASYADERSFAPSLQEN